VTKTWELTQRELAQLHELGDFSCRRQSDSLPQHAQSLEHLGGAELLRCLAMVAKQEACTLTEANSIRTLNSVREVRWRIKQAQEAHEYRFVETQALLNEVHATRALHTEALHQPLLNEACAIRVQQLRDVEMELESAKLALQNLKGYILRLELTKEAYYNQLTALQAKVRQIRGSDSICQQSSVVRLAAHVAKELALLSEEQAKTKLVLSQTMQAFHNTLPEAILSLKNIPGLPPDFPLPTTSSTPMWDFVRPSFLKPFIAPSSFLPHTVQRKLTEQFESVKLHRWAHLNRLSKKEEDETFIKTVKKRTSVLDEIERMKRQDKIQTSSWIPALAGCQDNAIKGLAQIPTVQEHIQHWWEQPGQFAVPFVRVKGKNIQECLQAMHQTVGVHSFSSNPTSL